jgi:hypothetical protein
MRFDTLCAASLCTLAVVLALLSSACKEVKFQGTKREAPFVPTAPAQPTPVFITLNVTKLPPEAWWKSCLYVSVNGKDDNAVSIGCNRDDTAEGRSIAIPADPKACNTLRFFMNVHQNKPGTRGAPGSPPPAEENPTCQRIASRNEDKSFFVIVDALTIGNLDKRVKMTEPKLNSDLFAKAQQNAQTMKFIRMFFEDADDASMEEYTRDIASSDAKKRLEAPDKYGIDFNDFVFDIEAKDVAVTVEGSGIPCALPPPANLAALVAKSPPGCRVNNLKAGPKTPSGATGP